MEVVAVITLCTLVLSFVFCILLLAPRVVCVSQVNALAASKVVFHLRVWTSIFFHSSVPHVVRNAAHLMLYSVITSFELIPFLRCFLYAVFGMYSVMCYFPVQGSGFSGGTSGLICDALFHLCLKSLTDCDYCRAVLTAALLMSIVLSASITQELVIVSILIVGRPGHSPFVGATRLEPGIFGHAAGRFIAFLAVMGDLAFKFHWAGLFVWLLPLVLFLRVAVCAHIGGRTYVCPTC